MGKTAEEIIHALVPIHVKDKDYVKENKVATRKEAIEAINQLLIEAKIEALEEVAHLATDNMWHRHTRKLIDELQSALKKDK